MVRQFKFSEGDRWVETRVDFIALVRDGQSAIARGDAASGCAILEKVVSAGRADLPCWLSLAEGRGKLGDSDGKLAAIEAALAHDPKSLAALLAKADHLASEGNLRAASAWYSAALRYLPQWARLPEDQRTGLRRAQTIMEKMARELEDFTRARLAADGFGGKNAPPRFAEAVELLFGRKQIYLQRPQYLYYPGLPQLQFYERGMFPWFAEIEGATEKIRTELMEATGLEFRPYVTRSADRPDGSQMGLLENPMWSAYFLWKDGASQPQATAFPQTISALASAPLAQIPGRSPSILFSRLAPGGHIPPHHGMLNARLICHLPLVVPHDCAFRVGNEIRAWEEGRAWAFDDTIEHEAWNRSGHCRDILLFDIWRPELSIEERAGVAALCEAVDAYRGRVSWDG